VTGGPALPYGLQKRHFEQAVEDLYDYLQTINTTLVEHLGLDWQEHIVRPAAVSNVISDFMQASLARHVPGLVVNTGHNGHPDLIPPNTYPNDAVRAGDEGVEIKSTRGSVADTHGARSGWVCQFNYWVDPEPVRAKRHPTMITKILLAKVGEELFRRNERQTELGTHTSTLDRDGLAVLRQGAIYVDDRFGLTNKPIPGKI
jgi:hypothetical protein